MMDSRSWSLLPDHIIINIFSFLSPLDRGRAGATCRHWNNCSKSPYLWQRFSFSFSGPSDTRTVECLDVYAPYMRSVDIDVNQHETQNRENACKVLQKLAHVTGRRLQDLKIRFTGENPVFYAGYEFVDQLKVLFGKTTGISNDKPSSQLRHIDLSGMSVAFDDSVFDILSEYHSQLQSLNIVNKILCCKVTPKCIERLVKRCRNLTDLRLFHCSMSDDVLKAFTEPDRIPPKLIGILCRREQKYSKDLSAEAWADLAKQSPDLKVILAFDHTCPLRNVSSVMKSEIPVADLRLETYTYIYDEVNQAASFYRDTLEKVVLQTRNSPDLAKSLLNLCRSCPKLTSLHVFCVLEKEIVDKILDLCPVMKEKGTYTLKWKPEDLEDLCVVGEESGD